MSMRTNVLSSPARATSRSTFAYAISSSNESPRCVSLSATFALSFSATSRSRMRSYSSVTAAVPAASGTASPRSVVFASRPAVVQLPQDGDALVERLARDEAGGTDPPAVLLHDALQPVAVGRVEDRSPRGGATPSEPDYRTRASLTGSMALRQRRCRVHGQLRAYGRPCRRRRRQVLSCGSDRAASRQGGGTGHPCGATRCSRVRRARR